MSFFGNNLFQSGPQNSFPQSQGGQGPLRNAINERVNQGQTNQATPTGNTAAVPMGGTPLPMPLANEALTQFVMQNMQMSGPEMALLIKNLLKLPQDIRFLLAMLATPEGMAQLAQQQGNQTQQKVFQQLLQLLQSQPNSGVPMESLQTLLQEKMGDSAKKLLTLIQQQHPASLAQGEGKSLSDMMTAMTQLSAAVRQSPAEALNTLLLVYLPWCPLEPPQKMSLHFERQQGSEEDEGSETGDLSLVVLMDTARLGRLRIALMDLSHRELMIRVDHDVEIESYTIGIEHKVNGALKEDGIPSPGFIWNLRSGAHNSANTVGQGAEEAPGYDETLAPSEQERQFALYPGAQVSVVAINAAYTLARVIFGIDEQLKAGEIPDLL